MPENAVTVMNDKGNPDFSSLLARISTLSLYIVLAAGLVSIAVGFWAIESGTGSEVENTLIRNILFLAGITEMAAIQFIKGSLLSKIRLSPTDDESNYNALLGPSIVISAMCSAISIYGLVVVLLGGSLEVLLLFVAGSLIGFQLFRIRPKDLEKLDIHHSD